MNIVGRLGVDIEIVQRHDKAGKIVIEVKELVET